MEVQYDDTPSLTTVAHVLEHIRTCRYTGCTREVVNYTLLANARDISVVAEYRHLSPTLIVFTKHVGKQRGIE